MENLDILQELKDSNQNSQQIIADLKEALNCTFTSDFYIVQVGTHTVKTELDGGIQYRLGDYHLATKYNKAGVDRIIKQLKEAGYTEPFVKVYTDEEFYKMYIDVHENYISTNNEVIEKLTN